MADDNGIRIVTTKSGFRVVVDIGDYHLIDGRAVTPRRFTNGRGHYFTVWRGGKNVLLHRLIMEPMQGQVVDHINGDTADNRRANLRVCTVAENRRNSKIRIDNTSGAKGVHVRTLRSGGVRYDAAIVSDGVCHYLGRFSTRDEAHAAYRTAAADLHGEFARFA